MKIEIQDTNIDDRSGVSKAGNQYEIHSQKGWFHTPDKKYPAEITINLSQGSQGYKKGEYSIHSTSFFINRYQQLTLASELKLVSIPNSQEKSA